MALLSDEPLESAFKVELPPAPYPGLRPFNTDEWPIFFGRERMTDEVVGRVISQPLVVVHGDSGCGKSSLVRAGVLAKLEQERARSGLCWRTAAMLPREAPLRRLAKTIAALRGAAHDPDQLHQIRRMLNRGADAPAALAAWLRGGSDDHVCILVDQFEELFAFAKLHGRKEAQLFVDVLVGLQQNPPPGLYAILTMRSEFLGHCARFAGLAEAVNKSQYLLPQMERPALVRAIGEPAVLYDGEVSRELAERLITDAGGHQDQLPLIQHGLMLLWRRKRRSLGLDAEPGARPSDGLAEAAARHGLDESARPYRPHGGPLWRLDLTDYEDAGRLADLLSKHADEVMAQACRAPGTEQPDPKKEKIVEHLFRALTDITAEGQATRRPQTLAQLLAVTGSDEPTLADIIDCFRANGVSFLRPYDPAPLAADNEIDISHEALIRCWQKIADPKEGWLQGEFRDGLIWKSLRLQAEEVGTLSAVATTIRDEWLETLPSSAWCARYGGGWADVQQLMDRSRQARDAELRRRQELEEARRREAEERARRAEDAEQASARLAEAHERIAAVQRQRAEAEKQKAAEAEARAREADAGRRRSRWMAIVAAGLALAALGAAGIAVVALRAEQNALKQTEIAAAEARTARNEAHLGDSILRSVQAQSELNHGRPVVAMQLALAGLPEDTGPTATRPWVSETGSVLFEATRRVPWRRALRGHTGSVYAAGYSPDGSRIASGSGDNTVRVWDAATGKQLLVLRGHQGDVWGVAFSPKGDRIVSGARDSTVRVWDASTGKQLLVLDGHGGAVWSVGFSPDGTRIVSGSEDASVRVWDATDGKQLLVLRGHEGRVSAAAFAPDGARIVSGSADETVRVWDATSGEQLLALRGHQGWVFTAGFSPDGQQIVSGSADNTVRVWDAASGAELRVLRGHLGAVNTAEFSPDGARIISGSDDVTLRVWDASRGTSLAVLPGYEGRIYAASFSPDGTRIVSGATDNTVRVWDAGGETGRLVLRGHQSRINSAAWSPDGSRVVSASHDGTVRIWDAHSGAQLLVLSGHDAPVSSAAFSPDGARVVSGADDRTVRVWDASNGQELLVLRGHQDEVWAVAFSPDGTRIVSGAKDGTVRLWEATKGAALWGVRGHDGPVMAVGFSPDGTAIVSTSWDKTVRLRNTADGKEQMVLRGHQQWIWAAAFSPDGARIVSASGDGTARVWDPASGEQLFALHGHEEGVRAASFSPDGAQIATGSEDKTVRIWDAASGQELLVLRDHGGPVSAVAFSPDGTRILSGSEDDTVRLSWVPRSTRELIETARGRLTREFTQEENRQFHLTAK